MAAGGALLVSLVVMSHNRTQSPSPPTSVQMSSTQQLPAPHATHQPSNRPIFPLHNSKSTLRFPLQLPNLSPVLAPRLANPPPTPTFTPHCLELLPSPPFISLPPSHAPRPPSSFTTTNWSPPLFLRPHRFPLPVVVMIWSHQTDSLSKMFFPNHRISWSSRQALTFSTVSHFYKILC